LWRVNERNHFTREGPWPVWSRKDSLFWPGVGATVNVPPTRTFASQSTPAAPDDDIEGYSQHLHAVSPRSPVDLPGAFLMAVSEVMFDDVTWHAFADFPSAVQHLRQQVRDDERHRIVGYEEVIPLGRGGSSDPVRERRRSEAFDDAALQILSRVARRGYKPKDAEDVTAAANRVLRRTRLDVAGYAKDLVWGLRDDAIWHDRLLEACGPLGPPMLHWLESQGGLPVDGRGESLCLERMPEGTWQALTQRSRHFLASALSHLAEQAESEQLDSAPIAIEVCKALEVELAQVLDRFRASWILVHGHDAASAIEPEDRNDQALARLIAGRKLELGAMQYLLAAPRATPSALRQALLDFLASYPTGDYLTSRKLNKALFRVTQTYRNGSAHDSPLDRNTALAAINEIVGTPDAAGILQLVVTPATNTPILAEKDGWSRTPEGWSLRMDYSPVSIWGEGADLSDDDARPPSPTITSLHGHDQLTHSDMLSRLGHGALAAHKQHSLAIGEAGETLLTLFSQMVENPELETSRPTGLLYDAPGSCAARVAPRLAAGVVDGSLLFAAVHLDDVLGGDALLFAADRTTSEEMASAVTRQPIEWMHPKRFVSMSRRAGCRTVDFRIARPGPPGGMIGFSLDEEATRVLFEVIAGSAAGRWGTLATASDSTHPSWVPRTAQ
jgi:hypothetical protein